MLEFLRSIPGKDFLWMFPIYVIAVTVVFSMLLNFARPKRYTKAAHSVTDPLLLISIRAQLKGIDEKFALLEYFLFNLWKKNSIELVQEKDGSTKYSAITPYSKVEAGTMDHMILYTIHKGALSFASLLRSFYVDSSLRVVKDKSHKKLIELGIMQNDLEYRRSKLLYLLGFLMAVIPGIVKMCLGVYYNKPISYLLIELIFVFVLVLILLKPSRVVQNIAQGILTERLNDSDIKELSDKAKNNPNECVDEDYATLIALFGGSYLAGLPTTAVFGTSIANLYSTSGSDGSSDSGSSCSSCSGGSDGGSSCSGCGGCGGGD